MHREELIEEAAKALYKSQWRDGDYERISEFNKDSWRMHARATLAVFEEAHTPTDDEREALWDAFDGMHRITEGGCGTRGDDVADMVLGLGFRRSEAPEPSADETLRLTDVHIAGREPQGEPSDALTIPRPHVPYGPHGVPEREADADYLDSAARNLSGGYAVGGYNVTSTVIKLLHDTATALRAAGGVR